MNIHLFEKQLKADRDETARNLHDSVGNQLTAAKVNLAACIRMATELKSDGAAALISKMEELQSNLYVTHENLWDIVHGRPYRLEGNLLVATKGLMKRMFATLPGVSARVVEDGWIGISTSHVEVELFRFLEGGLANVAEHSLATEIEVTLRQKPDLTEIVIFDNGKGFDVAMHRDSFGLRSLRARAVNVGGTCSIESVAGTGTTVSLSLDY
jgi:two-component system vancomycin resistance sensor histidine kinase VraS/NarL family two-component system sensor histidine kinase LiaS